MAYLNNPRRILGKVEIVYSDTDISSITNVETSSNSEISHPHEVYQTNLAPSVKACTLDGNSTMDGSFQMVDDSCVIGWWGGELSNKDGSFTNPPSLEVFFINRPIASWMIIGDSKLNQYPVDFKIEYKLNDEVIETEEITGNKQVQLKVYTMNSDITSIKITITKWSKGNAVVKLLKFFDMLSETYEGSDLQSFEVNEEMGSIDANYNLSSDTMTVSIYNKERKFNVGYLKNLLILDRKVKPYIGIEKDGVVEYMSLGTFYSDEWKVDQDGQWVKCTAVDRLIRLQNKIYVGFPLTFNVTLYQIAYDILNKSGFKDNEFIISESLQDTTIANAFMPKQSVWDALQEIAYTGLCKVFIDREDRINILAETDNVDDSNIEINPGNMFSYSSNILLTEFANRISVEYCDIELSEDLVEAASTWITLKPGEVVEVTLDYSVDIAYAEISINTENITISNFSSGINACTVTLANDQDKQRQGTLTVKGNAIDVTYRTLSIQDDNSVRDYGTFEYKHPSTQLIQSSTHAKKLAQTLLSKMKAGEGVVTSVWRGSPSVKVGNKYTCVDKYGDINNFVCEYNKITFDGGLKQETRGRKVTKEE